MREFPSLQSEFPAPEATNKYAGRLTKTLSKPERQRHEHGRKFRVRQPELLEALYKHLEDKKLQLVTQRFDNLHVGAKIRHLDPVLLMHLMAGDERIATIPLLHTGGGEDPIVVTDKHFLVEKESHNGNDLKHALLEALKQAHVKPE